MRKVITALLSIILVGCFSSSYDDYLGYWKKEGAGLTILEIKKEGSNYFVTPNFIVPFLLNTILIRIYAKNPLRYEWVFRFLLVR